jgi:hypothetical protein
MMNAQPKPRKMFKKLCHLPSYAETWILHVAIGSKMVCCSLETIIYEVKKNRTKTGFTIFKVLKWVFQKAFEKMLWCSQMSWPCKKTWSICKYLLDGFWRENWQHGMKSTSWNAWKNETEVEKVRHNWSHRKWASSKIWGRRESLFLRAQENSRTIFVEIVRRQSTNFPRNYSKTIEEFSSKLSENSRIMLSKKQTQRIIWNGRIRKAVVSLKTGWPDEFVKNIAQNVAQYIFVIINA